MSSLALLETTRESFLLEEERQSRRAKITYHQCIAAKVLGAISHLGNILPEGTHKSAYILKELSAFSKTFSYESKEETNLVSDILSKRILKTVKRITSEDVESTVDEIKKMIQRHQGLESEMLSSYLQKIIDLQNIWSYIDLTSFLDLVDDADCAEIILRQIKYENEYRRILVSIRQLYSTPA